jgi:hypothetical protein
MRHERLVLDANILIRAVPGRKVRNLIERYCGSVAFYVAEANVQEAEFYGLRNLPPSGGWMKPLGGRCSRA